MLSKTRHSNFTLFSVYISIFLLNPGMDHNVEKRFYKKWYQYYQLCSTEFNMESLLDSDSLSGELVTGQLLLPSHKGDWTGEEIDGRDLLPGTTGPGAKNCCWETVADLEESANELLALAFGLLLTPPLLEVGVSGGCGVPALCAISFWRTSLIFNCKVFLVGNASWWTCWNCAVAWAVNK